MATKKQKALLALRGFEKDRSNKNFTTYRDTGTTGHEITIKNKTNRAESSFASTTKLSIQLNELAGFDQEPAKWALNVYEDCLNRLHRRN